MPAVCAGDYLMPLPTVAELLALPYTGSGAQNLGMTIADFQQQQLSAHGEPVRWWKRYRAPDDTIGPNGEAVDRFGMLSVEQQLDEGVKVYIDQTERSVFTEEFGWLKKGQTRISCNPAIMELTHDDWICLTTRLMTERIAVTPSTSTTSLQRRFVAEIVEVTYDGAVMDPDDYELTEADDETGQIHWLNSVPGSVVLIEFRYHPLYVYLDVEDRNPPRGADGERLLQRGILTLEQKGAGSAE